MKTKITTLLMLSLTLVGVAGINQEISIFSKSVDVKPYTTLDITHQFGNIECTSWSKNTVNIEIFYKGDMEDTDRIKRNIDIDFSVSPRGLTLETHVRSNNNQGKNEYNIMVTMPSAINLVIDNKFGSTFVEHVSGSTDIDSKFGNLTCELLEGKSNSISNQFGNANIENITQGNITSANGNLEITKGETLEVESKFGNTTIIEVNTLIAECKNGKFSLGEVENLEYKGSFGSIEVEKVSGTLSMENAYGSSHIKKLLPSVSDVSVENKFGSVKIGISKETTFELECEVKFGSFYYPEELSEMKEIVSSAVSKSYKGIIGKKGRNVEMSLESKNGDIIIYTY